MAGETVDWKNVRFIDVEEGPKEWLTRASSLLCKRGHDPVWLDSKAIEQEVEDNIYVLESFDTDSYRVLHGNATVLSARAIVEHLTEGLLLPRQLKHRSVYSLLMSNVNVTFTSIAREKRTKLCELVRLMGGEATGDLTLKTTHLICGEVKSLKYKIASKANLPIILPSWIEYVWNAVTTTDRIFAATEYDLISKHHCGVFQGLVICVTGLDANKRKDIQILAQKHGGIYSGEMKRDDCTHLLVEKPEGQKYLFARKWQLCTVHPTWFFESVAAGVCLPEDGYKVSPPPEHSSSVPSSSQPWAVALSEFRPSSDMNNVILEKCKIYISGFPRVHAEKLSDLIQLLGAVRLKQLNSSVTHAIVGQEDPEETRKLTKFRNRIKFVKVEWLLECAVTCTHVEESRYGIDFGENSIQSTKDVRTTAVVSAACDEDDIMSLYYGVKSTEGKVLKNILVQKVVYVSPLLTEDKQERIREYISHFGATVASKPPADYVVVPLFISKDDFDTTAGQGLPITICWLESLEEAGTFIPADNHFLYMPICGQLNSNCLTGCVVYVSQYDGLERKYLQSLAGKLGGTFSENFHRGCTHLILKEPTGEKYKAAVKWSIPTIRDSWLFSCATSGCKVPENTHSVCITQSQQCNTDDVAEKTVDVITPFRTLQPSLSTTGAMHALQTTKATTHSQDQVSTQQLGNLFTEALANIKPNDEDQIVPTKAISRPFKDVVVVVNKTLVKKQAELHTLVTDLGGSYKWTFDATCTHYIYQGKRGSISKVKELKSIKGKKCYFVSPHWIYSCSETQRRLGEDQFPYTYKPRKTLSTIPVKILSESMLEKSPRAENQSQSTAKIDIDVMLTDESKSSKVDDERTADMDDFEGVIESNTLQEREYFQEQVEELNKQWQTSKKRSRSRIQGPSDRVSGPSRRAQGRTLMTNSSSKRRKISGSDEDSNSLDSGVRWETSSQTVTYENPMAKTGQEQIMAMIRNAEAYDHYDEHTEMEVPSVDHPIEENMQDENLKPSSSTLVVPIVTKGDSTKNSSCQVMYDDHDQVSGPRTRPPQKKFMFSSIPTETRVNYGSLVSELGGHVVDAQYFNPSCTHVIVGKASRNEKYLSSLAAGKWVLHVSYIEACREAGKFVDEWPHEWGTVVSGKQPTALEEAAKKWRLELMEKRKVLGPKAGAFNGWKIILAVDNNRLAGMKRLLEAGGAEVLGVRAPFARYSEATHAFVDLNKWDKLNIDKNNVKKWMEVGLQCYKPDYIAEYLMHGDLVDGNLHTISLQELC